MYDEIKVEWNIFTLNLSSNDLQTCQFEGYWSFANKNTAKYVRLLMEYRGKQIIVLFSIFYEDVSHSINKSDILIQGKSKLIIQK